MPLVSDIVKKIHTTTTTPMTKQTNKQKTKGREKKSEVTSGGLQ